MKYEGRINAKLCHNRFGFMLESLAPIVGTRKTSLKFFKFSRTLTFKMTGTYQPGMLEI